MQLRTFMLDMSKYQDDLRLSFPALAQAIRSVYASENRYTGKDAPAKGWYGNQKITTRVSKLIKKELSNNLEIEFDKSIPEKQTSVCHPCTPNIAVC